MAGARFDSRLSTAILQEMWEKWVFIATMAGITCLMRAPVGDIVAAGAVDLDDRAARRVLGDCRGARLCAARSDRSARSRTMLTAPGSTFAASMLRDIERGAPIEADHIVGDLLRRGESATDRDHPLLRIAYAHLKAYEARRKRENAASPAA